ncbi:ABC transporter permease [Bacillus sp. REN3]|uniref:ABC transporter permease n=1 Tax=Bacillus sp. REN3 TaxID=2802440 RepID=UPI001AEE105C|nr:ABC transporter permease [Bacillus sp. REN3]
MRKIMAVAWLHLKSFIVSPAAIIMMFVMPILFSVIFGGMGSGNSSDRKPLVLIVSPGDESEDEIVKLLIGNDQYQWRVAAKKEARELVSSQKAIAAVMIANEHDLDRLETGPLFEVIVQRKTQEYEALRRYLEGAGKTVGKSAQFATGLDSPDIDAILQKINGQESVSISKEIIQKDEENTQAVSLLAIGFTIMFMMFGISGAASAILDERTNGTWQRLLASPASKREVMAGYLLSYFLMGWIQLGVLMAAMKLIYGAGWGNLFYFIPFATIVILTIVGFSLMLASLVKTRQQASALGTVLIVSTCMLGGVYWPLDIVPDFMKLIAKAVPQSWMITGFNEIISGSLYMPAILSSVFVLAVFSVFFFVIGLKKVKYY